jgi:hypothetical protein
MPDIRIDIADGITAKLESLIARTSRPRALMAALGKELEVRLRAHFADKDKKGNKKGWPSRHFWSGVRSATARTDVTDNTATVSIASPAFAHKLSGGRIEAPPGKALGIPLTPEANSAGRARLFPRPLTMVCRPGKPPLLVETGTIGKSKAWKMHYVLVPSVDQEADPDAMPPRADLEKALVARGDQVVQSETARMA